MGMFWDIDAMGIVQYTFLGELRKTIYEWTQMPLHKWLVIAVAL